VLAPAAPPVAAAEAATAVAADGNVIAGGAAEPAGASDGSWVIA
jgi:hypothetical protein